MFCTQCGKANSADARFCAKCGHTVTAGPQESGPYALALHYLETGHTANATALLTETLADGVAADDTLARGRLAYILAIAHLRRDEIPEARVALEMTLAYDPDNVVARAYYGIVLLECAEVDTARETLQDAICRDPTNAVVHIKMGEFFYRLGFYPDALRSLDSARKLPMPNASTAAYATHLYEQTRKKSKNIVVRSVSLPSLTGVRRRLEKVAFWRVRQQPVARS